MPSNRRRKVITSPLEDDGAGFVRERCGERGRRTESNRSELLCSGVYCARRTIADTVKTTVMTVIDARN